MKKYRFSVVERDEEGYLAFCPELQGCYTQGMTYEEVLENIHDPPYPGAPSIGGRFSTWATRKTSLFYELACLVKEMTGSASEIVFVPYDQAHEEGFEDMPQRLPDLSKIQALVGYCPTLWLPEMLERVIAYERGRLRQEQ